MATGGAQATGGGSLASLFADVSDKRRYVAFTSTATNWSPGDTNGVQDIFVHDRQIGSTTRVSVGPSGVQQRRERGATNQRRRKIRLVSVGGDKPGSGDTNGLADCFRPRQADWRHDASQRGDRWCTGDGGHNFITAISANGRYVAFSPAQRIWSPAIPMACRRLPPRSPDGMTIRVSVATGGAQVVRPGQRRALDQHDGRFVGFYFGAENLVPAIPMGALQLPSMTSRPRPRRGRASVRAGRRQMVRAWSGRSANEARSAASSRPLPIGSPWRHRAFLRRSPKPV